MQRSPNRSATNRVAAIILAAGYSSRMGEFKPSLPLGSATAFERCIQLFRAAEVAVLVAVLGHRADQLQPKAERCGVRCVFNPEFDRGMYSSIVAGIRTLPHWVEAAFILPADIPLVRAATIRQLARTRAASRAGILYPIFNGLRGHPPLIDRGILDEAARENSTGPLCAVLASHESEAVEVRVADMAIHMDMDTPADYEALLSLDARRDIPSAAECKEILATGNVELRVVQHSRKVAEIAGRIALALLRSGHKLDAGLVHAGALLHDLAKGQSDHAAVGASALRTLGFDRVADVVADHTDLSTRSRLDETAIVYLADKLVRGEQVVTIKERFKPALMRFRKDPAALEGARKRMRNARKVASAVESQVGASLATIVSGDLSSKDHHAGQTSVQEAGA